MIVYVDGANLFHRLLKGTPYLWLDVMGLSRAVLPEWHVTEVKYFAAEVRASPHDPYKTQRHRRYLAALREREGIEVHLGSYRRYVAALPVHPWRFTSEGEPVTAAVKHNREKGSDVSLAAHLVWDAVHGVADAFAIMSNDADFVAPISMLRTRRALNIGVLTPGWEASRELRNAAAWTRHIRVEMLRDVQLPNPVRSRGGQVIAMPPEWG